MNPDINKARGYMFWAGEYQIRKYYETEVGRSAQEELSSPNITHVRYRELLDEYIFLGDTKKTYSKTPAENIIQMVIDGSLCLDDLHIVPAALPGISAFIATGKDPAFVYFEGRIPIAAPATTLLRDYLTWIIQMRSFFKISPNSSESEQNLDVIFYNAALSTLERNEGNYASRSNPARAIGVWLWDYIIENNCSISHAIRSMKDDNSFLAHLGFERSPDRVFERHYQRTRACIEAGEVLSMNSDS